MVSLNIALSQRPPYFIIDTNVDTFIESKMIFKIISEENSMFSF